MCTLRQLETNTDLNRYFDGLMREMVRHIVGVQFRNGATVGGSLYGRYGFSDVLTALLVLDTEVELYKAGRMSLRICLMITTSWCGSSLRRMEGRLLM